MAADFGLMVTKTRILALVLGGLCAGGYSGVVSAAAESPPIKLAVVDVGTQEKLPPAFLDLLLASFRSQRDIAMVERADIKKVLNEQACSLAMSGPTDSQCAIKVGKLCAADAFLMLEASKSATNSVPLRLRLVDARYGLKVWDAALLLETPSGNAAEIELVTRTCSGKLAQIQRGLDGLVAVGVAAFRSEEMSKRWDWLSDALAKGIEQRAGLLPGVILTERAQANTLLNERELVGDLPESLRASAMLVDGAYRIDRAQGSDVISLYLRCRRNAAVLSESRIEGSITNLPALYRRAAEVASTRLGATPDTTSMDAGAEAALLAIEARAYLTRQEPFRALAVAELPLCHSGRTTITPAEGSSYIELKCFLRLMAHFLVP